MKKVIYGFGLLVFLVICCNQEVLANVTLNVNAKSSTLANKIYYTTASGAAITVTLPWKEKVVYGGDGEVAITVNSKLKGDLIIKVDFVTASSGRAGVMTVDSAWLKYDKTGGFSQTVEIISNGDMATGGTAPGDVVDKTKLVTLCLAQQLTANTTLYLFNYVTKLTMPTHIIFTAILVDDSTAATPQVMGLDVQTVFFNYQTTPTTIPIWLDLITSD